MQKWLSYQISPARFRIVLGDIARGSEPAGRFYILVAVSTMIASFGLVTNSTSVIIGAMLVAPLMTPIFGIALGLVRGDTTLIGQAMRAEIAGVCAAVVMGFILGHLYPALEATPEMLARTQPQLFDLLVAVFSGFAGAYALVDEHISPALPGVAIATAIVPPLANCGICFSLEAYKGGIGSFLLFFANFLSILVVASITFWFVGMTRDVAAPERKAIVRRFGLPIMAFIMMAVFLSHALYQIVRAHGIEKTIHGVLGEALAELPATGLDQMIYSENEGKIFVLARAHSAIILSPQQVTRIQERLSAALQHPSELIIRNTTARDISALGSFSQITAQNLDGFFISKDPNPHVVKTKIVDTVLRDYLTEWIGFDLLDVGLLKMSDGPVAVATISGFTPPSGQQIADIEQLLQDKTEDPALRLLLRFIKTDLRNRDGPIYLEWSGLKALSNGDTVAAEKARQIIRSELDDHPNLFLISVNVGVNDEGINIFLELTGTSFIAPETVTELERRVSLAIARTVSIQAWFRSEAVVSASGYQSVEAVSQQAYEKQEPQMKEDIQSILQRSGM
jgi:uncharacterized hydrophobic protein (TIGR00271 family)